MSKRKAKRFQEEYTCVDSLLHVFASSPDSNLLLKERKLIKDGSFEYYDGLTKEGHKALKRLSVFLRSLKILTGADIPVNTVIDNIDMIAAEIV